MDIKYPRPQMRREKYILLDGEWECNGLKIQVPYPPQSELSGYRGPVEDQLSYKKTFYLPEKYCDGRILLHFGAVDQICQVFVNDKYVGEHQGGYIDFTLDITEYVYIGKENLLSVEVEDKLDYDYPYGKQSKNPAGMWYTPVSGIWQSVWIEPVPVNYISEIRIKSTMKAVNITVSTHGQNTGYQVKVYSKNHRYVSEYTSVRGEDVQITLRALQEGWIDDQPGLWDTENPNLYDIEIITKSDFIKSYIAFRTVEIAKVNHRRKLLLNKKPLFLHGVLDQGYYQDGIFLPAELKEYEKDILRMKELGFNTLRKHIKIEPEAFYYYCDKHGMIVIQDMVNSGQYNQLRDTILPTIGAKYMTDKLNTSKDRKRKDFFIKHCKDTVNKLYNHPSILIYTIFNESWGQFESDRIYAMLKKLDPSRLYDSTSGWFAQLHSDFDSVHIYFRNAILLPKVRPMLLSECGGYTLKVEGHLFKKDKIYGYGGCQDKKELSNKILKMYNKMVLPAIPLGLCGCIYTQLSDVEEEINGLYTYDRQVCKVDVGIMQYISSRIDLELKYSKGLRSAIKLRREDNHERKVKKH